MLEVRKLQKVGTSTLTVSLPKKWVIKKGLKPGDRVTISENEDGSLRLDLNGTKVEELKFTINYDTCKSPGLLARFITATYMQGVDTLKIISSTNIPEEALNEIQDTVDMLPGFEIVEQTQRRVVIQSFIEPAKFPVEALIKRLQVMVMNMLNTLVSAISEWRLENLDDIFRQEKKINELYFLIIRQLFIALKRWHLGISIGIDSPVYAAGARVIVKNLEEIGDILKDVAKELINMKKVSLTLNQEVASKVGELGNIIQTLFGKTMKAMSNLDIELLNEIFNSSEQVCEYCNKLTEDILMSIDSKRSLATVRTILWSFNYIARSCKIMAEIAFNRLVRITSESVQSDIVST